MQFILALISILLFLLLCIGLIKPTLASNIMEKLPEPIGNFSKGINSRKKVLLYYGLLFLFIQIIISSLIPLSDYDAGKKYYDKNDWSKAISYFNDVPTLDVNYNEAQRLLLIAKNNLIKGEPDKALEVAKIAFKEKRWNEVIDLLHLFPQEHTLNEEVDKLVFNAKENKFNEEMELMIEKATKQLMEYNWDEVSETDRDEVNKLLLTIPNEHRLFSKAKIILSKARGRKSQQDFINKWKKLKKIHDYDGGDRHLKQNRSKVVDWIGIVKYISLSTIQLEHSGIEYNLYPEFPLDTNNQHIELLDKGEKVFFTGSLNGEKSWSENGRLSEPEIKIKCYKIINVDETEIYYDLTDNVEEAKVKAKRKERLAKEEAKRKEEEEVRKRKTQEAWVGTYSGICPSYKMTKADGSYMIYNGNYAILPEVGYKFFIYYDNKSSLCMLEGMTYEMICCKDINYSIASLGNNSSLTIYPVSGSDCGGNPIILIKNEHKYTVKEGQSGSMGGRPSFTINKVK